ncbi:hypothetical protein L208DRAFT_1420331 [Tricholoma matsutake]|nr:hypothetical protein L208DRAFT_1420331 [Tricholoma matsutake 945]
MNNGLHCCADASIQVLQAADLDQNAVFASDLLAHHIKPTHSLSTTPPLDSSLVIPFSLSILPAVVYMCAPFFALDHCQLPWSLKTWRTLLNLISTENIPRLPQIFKNSKLRNWSVEKLLEMVQMALEGKYHPRNYSELELDLATTIYELGGRVVLHALHNSPFAFPSWTTLLDCSQDFQLQMSVGSIKMVDLLANIKTMKLSSVRMGTNLDVVHNIAQAVRDGQVHIGQEVFMATFARNDKTDYGAEPLSPYGESLHGPIWSIGSDRDPKFMPDDPLFSHVGNLPGLNLWTGSGGETQDLDYKHDFKCICKCLCARQGILIDSVVINKSLLAMWLERLTDLLKLSADVQNSTHRVLSLLSEVLEAVIEPFINPEFSISQQITSLMKISHIACALFLKHKSGFMPLHLYSDLQCMFQTAIFRVAHTKNLNPNLKVLLSA